VLDIDLLSRTDGIALANLLRNVEAAGMSAQDVVKLTFYLTEPIDPERRAVILGKHLGDHRTQLSACAHGSSRRRPGCRSIPASTR
jgi:enamine deaminase RidA (YjgF/YER057c/UK114 family)